MARRHVAEGEERVARQEILIAELDHDGHAELAVKARALFTMFQTSLQLLRNDLSRIESESRAIRCPRVKFVLLAPEYREAAVLCCTHQPPLDSPQAAVRAAIVAERRTTR